MNKQTQTGFTLYELLTTVLVVGVILTLGIPNMTEFRQNSRMTAAANDLHTTFHRARSDATRLRGIVTICSSTDGATCGGEFEDGWIAFIDDNLNGVADATDGNIRVDANEAILRSFGPINDEINIDSGNGNDYFSFAASGQGRGAVVNATYPANGSAAVGTLLMCDARGFDTAPGGRATSRVLIVTPLGRATVLSNKAQVEPVVTARGGC